MKKMFLTGISVCLFFASCSGGDDSDTDPGPDPNPTAVTYNGNVRAIMQANCVSCHGNPPTNAAPMSLTTFTEVRNAVTNRGLEARINSTANPMPPTGLMSASVRKQIEDWIDQGMPEN